MYIHNPRRSDKMRNNKLFLHARPPHAILEETKRILFYAVTCDRGSLDGWLITVKYIVLLYTFAKTFSEILSAGYILIIAYSKRI